MYNQGYEEYMRNILGYIPNYQENTYRDNNYYSTPNQPYYNDKLEAMYPEIYRTVYPKIVRELGMNTRSITEDRIEEIVNKIYDEVEGEQNREIKEPEKVEQKSTQNSTISNVRNTKNAEPKEDRVSRPRNNLLRDLIRILIIREILGRPNFPNRPPFPPGGPDGRPPFPGGPGMPPPRPRDYYI